MTEKDIPLFRRKQIMLDEQYARLKKLLDTTYKRNQKIKNLGDLRNCFNGVNRKKSAEADRWRY